MCFSVGQFCWPQPSSTFTDRTQWGGRLWNHLKSMSLMEHRRSALTLFNGCWIWGFLWPSLGRPVKQASKRQTPVVWSFAIFVEHSCLQQFDFGHTSWTRFSCGFLSMMSFRVICVLFLPSEGLRLDFYLFWCFFPRELTTSLSAYPVDTPHSAS